MLANEWAEGRVTSAIFIAFNMGVFRTAQTTGARPPQSFPFCVPRARIAFDYIEPISGARRPGKSPPQDSAIVFLPDGPRDDSERYEVKGIKRFLEAFSPIGYVRT
jgi:hypothetical protein